MRYRAAIILSAFLCSPSWAGTYDVAAPCAEADLNTAISNLNSGCTGDKTITFNNCTASSTIYIDDDTNTEKRCNGGDSANKICTGTGDGTCPDSDPDPEAGPCSLNTDGCNASGTGCTASNTPYQCCTGSGTGTCCTGDKTNRIITCAGAIIDGTTQDITIKLDPPCDARVGATNCTELENQAYLFRIEGAGVTVRNLTMSHFWEGIHNFGDGTVIEDMTMNRGCDDVFTNLGTAPGPGTNTIVQNNTITNGCDKCFTLNGADIGGTSDYDTSILNNTFATCRVPIVTQDGRHLIEGNTVDGSVGQSWTCHQLDLGAQSSHNPAVYFKDNEVYECRHGIHVAGKAEFKSLGGNMIRDNDRSGFSVFDDAKATLECDTIRDNGGNNDADYEGGIVVAGSGILDAGGGSQTIDGNTVASVGNNTITGNQSDTDATQDFHNATGTATIKIESNWWGADADPTGKVLTDSGGTTDYTPWLPGMPNCSTTGFMPGLNLTGTSFP